MHVVRYFSHSKNISHVHHLHVISVYIFFFSSFTRIVVKSESHMITLNLNDDGDDDDSIDSRVWTYIDVLHGITGRKILSLYPCAVEAGKGILTPHVFNVSNILHIVYVTDFPNHVISFLRLLYISLRVCKWNYFKHIVILEKKQMTIYLC